MLASTQDSSPCNVTFGPSAATRARAWNGDGGGDGGGSWGGYPIATVVNDTPPSPTSPNPYKRRGLLRHRSPPPPPQRKFNLDDGSSSKGTTGRLRLPPPVSPSDNYFHDNARTEVLYPTTAAGDGRSDGATAGGSPLLLDSSCRSSRASSRSASPHKRPWYPAGPRPSSGGNGDASGGGDDESAYVVHPTFRHMFKERDSNSDADRRSRIVIGRGDARFGGGGNGGRRGASSRQSGPTHGVAGGLSRSPPTTAAVSSQRAERGRNTGLATGGGGRDRTSAYFSTEQISTPDNHRRSEPTTAPALPWVVNGRRTSSTQDGGASSAPAKSTMHVGLNSDAFPCARRNNQNNTGTERSHVERGKMGQRAPSRETSRQKTATVRGRVRDLQTSQVRPRPQDSRERLSARDNSTGGGDPRLRSSAVFLGHTEQVLALAHHEDILFSAAVDGTAKAWDAFSQQCLATYEGHRKAVWGMQVTNRTLITGSADCTVRFWDIETAQSLQVIDLCSAVRDVVIVGGFLAVATSNPGIEVVDLHCMEQRGRLEGHLLAVSAVAALEGEELLVSGSHDTFLRVWEPAAGNCEAVLGGHRGTVGALCTISWPPTPAEANRTNETTNEQETLIISGSGDSTVRVWGRAGGVGELGEWACRAVLGGHRHGVWAVHGSSLSGVIATGGGDATVKIWAPGANTGDNISGDNVTLKAGKMVSKEYVQEQQQQQQQGWECVGGVRGAAGAVGALLMNEQALVFGTSEALIARFPLQSCMPAR